MVGQLDSKVKRVGRGRVGSRASSPASVEVCISGAVSQRHG